LNIALEILNAGMMKRVVIAGALFLLSWASPSSEATMKIDESLSKELEASGDANQLMPVIVTLERREDIASLAAKGVRPRIIYENITAVAAELTRKQVLELAAMPEVKSLELDTEARALANP